MYSLHKAFAFSDVTHEGQAVSSIGFDKFGIFLAVGFTNKLLITSYRNWLKPLALMGPFDSSLDFSK